MIVADLHIHSRYSRATSKALDPEHLWLAAQTKGVDLLGSGDFTHPAWIEELREKLAEDGEGAFELKPELRAALEPEVPRACQRPVRFLLSGEISCIYKRHGKTRKVHNLILMPDFQSVERLNSRLDKLGNIKSDGRPILGLDSHDLLELCLEVCPEVIFIPAHIWTPWFSMFGSKSGFDSIEECFDDLCPHIHALETGLSSDPPMNWRISALDRFILVSHSDAHSPAKLAREADLLECPPTYQDLAAALEDGGNGTFAGTLEFFPHEGKYHLDGHRKCGLCLEPEETRELGGKCPVCGKPLTVGVMSRVNDLADREPGEKPPNAKPFESIVPLPEVLGEVLQRGPNTKGVAQALGKLLDELGPELFILRQAPLDLLEKHGGPVLAEAIRRMRSGQVKLQAGYDGEFGVVKLFSPSEQAELKGQKPFWDLKPARKKKRVKPKKAVLPKPEPAQPLLTALDPVSEGLNPEQEQAVRHSGGHLIVRAGPGSGKTRVLVHRIAWLVDSGASPDSILAVTFTNKAADEMAIRLAELKPGASPSLVLTFHSLGRRILAQALGREPVLLDEDQRLELIAPIAKQLGHPRKDLALEITRFKQGTEEGPAGDLAPAFAAYQEALARAGAHDLDDLVREAMLLLQGHPFVAELWRQRFSHILVDEYQDVNPAQAAMLGLLCGPGCAVSAIGDPDQAIYGFRGAERGVFNRFSRDFPGAALMELKVNYRSQGGILDAAQSLICHEPDSLRIPLQAHLGEGPLPVACQLATPQAEARWLAGRVAGLLGGMDSRQVEAGDGDDGGYSAGDVAVLYRLHAQAEPIAQALREAGVPVQVATKEPLAEVDPLDFKAQRVSLLSMHAAKGLEWPVVFVTGLEEGLLPYLPPGRPAADSDEERRLLFVAMTRARERLFLSRAKKRTLYGKTYQPGPSPFWLEIEPSKLEQETPSKKQRRAHQLELFS